MGQDVLLGDRLEQTEPDHRRRHARAQHHLRMHRPVAEVRDPVAGRAQMDHLAARELDRVLRVVDHHAPFRLVAGDREVLQLAAVGRLATTFAR